MAFRGLIDRAAVAAAQLVRRFDLASAAHFGTALVAIIHEDGQTIDQRLADSDPFAVYDAVVDAITELEGVRSLLDAVLIEPSGQPTHAPGSLARLNELRERMTAWESLFTDKETAGLDASGKERHGSRSHHRSGPASHGR